MRILLSKFIIFTLIINSPGPKIAIFQNMGTMDETYIDIEINKTHNVKISQTKHVNKVETCVEY